MDSEPPVSKDSHERVAWLDVVTYATTAVAWATSEWFFSERDAYRSLLGLGSATLRGDERWMVPLIVIGKTVSFVLPALLVGSGLAIAKRRRAGLFGYLLLGVIGAVLGSLDLRIYEEFGRHIGEMLRFVALPRGHEAVGDTSAWSSRVAWTSLGLMAGFVALSLASRTLVHAGLRRASRGFVISLSAVSVGSALALPASTLSWASGPRQSIVLERVYSSLPFEMRPARAKSRFSDPTVDRLASGLEERYQRAFPRILAQHPLPPEVRFDGGLRPNILLIVIESWRSDALDGRVMPRLDAWSRSGMRLEHHYAGSDYSEAGMFALLYGRSPLVYHAALDAKLHPDLCEVARRAGYSTAYFSGQPLDWMRQEEFINSGTFDRFEHDDAGSWVDWDRRAMAHAVATTREHGDKPTLAVAYLMSSHFEYRYPPEYERHLPVDQHVHLEDTNMATLGADLRIPLTNRYENSLGFLDDLIADSLQQLDATRDLVIVTGDHGESLGDDGRFGHGYGFPEVVARTPMVLRGPGIGAAVVTSPTMHVDLLPTLAHVLAGYTLSLPEVDGVDLLADGTPPRTSLLLAHCGFERNSADALLIAGTSRTRLDLGLKSADVTLEGFEDLLGHVLPYATLSPDVADQRVADFDRELLIIGGRGGF